MAVIPLDLAQPGDLVFCDSQGLISRLIRMAEWVRWRGGAKWNHTAILKNQLPNGEWIVYQAEGKGVTDFRTLTEAVPGGSYEIVRAPAVVNRERVLAFAAAQVRDKYGFLSIASVVLNIITPAAIDFRSKNSWICSALAGEALRCGGWIHSWPSCYEVSPAELYLALTASAS